jgi:hypothetical protein
MLEQPLSERMRSAAKQLAGALAVENQNGKVL